MPHRTPLRVLLIEDSPNDALLMVREIERDYRAAWLRVETAAQFLDALNTQEWDIILADYSLPQFSAPAALALIQGIGLDTPVVIVSGTIRDGTAGSVVQIGAADYVRKDQLSRLRTVVPHVLGVAEEKRREAAEQAAAFDELVEAWSGVLELRDRETEGHSQRVTDLTVGLARLLGVDDKALVHIRRGARLHDIGKIGIPDSVLFKPGPLTPDEWAVMQTHPQLAYDKLVGIAYLRLALDIPYCHHEHWDGSGYPRGLAGEEIPYSARIFAVVDVWDALRSDRPYKQAMDVVSALAELRRVAGMILDPAIVARFCQAIETGAL